MKRAMSIAALKQHNLPRITAKSITSADVIKKPAAFSLSRRQALGIVGLGSLTAAPLASALNKALSATYSMRRRSQSVVFSVAGKERWVIDPRNFDGSPSLHVKESDDGVLLSLTGAFYPGTTIPASFEARISSASQPSIQFKFPNIGTTSSALFVAWLLDRSSCSGETDSPVRWLVGSTQCALPSNTEFEFRPSWTLAFTGVVAININDHGVKALKGAALEIELLDRNGPTMLVPAPEHHTIVRLSRGSERWNIPLDLAATESWTVESHDDAFDQVSIEASNDVRSCIVFEGHQENRTALIASAINLRLPLREVRYAWTENENGLHQAFVARYSSTPHWTIVDGVGLELGDSPHLPPLEIERRNGELVRCIVAPGFKRYNIPIDGAITEPTRLGRDSQLALWTDGVPSAALPKSHVHLASLRVHQERQQGLTIQKGAVQGSGDNTKKRFSLKQTISNKSRYKFELTLANNPSVTVIRPEDMLVLAFEFDGMTLNKSGGTFNFGSKGKLIVHFQPQHIAERAFFYVSENPQNNDAAPASSGKNNGNEPLVEPPIDSVIAGPTRLVFSAPNGHTGRYTLAGLLDWSKYTQSVSPSAKPPPVKYALGVMGGSFIGKYLSNDKANPTVSNYMVVKTNGKSKAAPSTPKRAAVNSGLLAKVPANSRSSIQTKMGASQDFAGALSETMINDYIGIVDTKPPITTPTDTQTVIEYPYRMMLSPNKYAAWAHADMPKTDPDNGRTELWHTRLGVKHADGSVNEEAAYFRTVRAIWSPDLGTSYSMSDRDKEKPFRGSINRRDRHEIVNLTSNYNMQTEDQPIDVKRMMLTSLGAWADMVGAWEPIGADNLDVEQWIQRGTQGRDHFVRICYKGYLFPFGNKATLVKETERKFRRTPRGDMAAYLMQRMYIILREPVREFPADGLAGMRYQGRGMPFRRVTIKTKTTPNLRLPSETQLKPGNTSTNTFWPTFNDTDGPADVRWTCVARDWDNNDVEFSVPLAFIANSDATAGNSIEQWVEQKYRTQLNDKRTIDMAGQVITYAPSSKKGDTSLPTQTFKLTGYYSSGVEANEPRFFPSMEDSQVRVEKVNELLGTDATQRVKFFFPYLKYAFEKGQTVAKGAPVDLDKLKNTAQIFLALDSQLSMDFAAQSDKSGGLAAPSINIGALSRLMGPIPGDFKIAADLDDEVAALQQMAQKVEGAAIAAGNFDPMEYFADILKSKILGDITLQDVLDFVQDVMSNAESMPALDKKDDFGVSDAIDSALSKSQIAQELADKVLKNDAVKSAASAVQNLVNAEVAAAKQQLDAEIASVNSEINAAKQAVLNEVANAKKQLDNQVREWKKRVEDRVNVLKSEIDKAVQPLKEAGNEAYKKYTQAAEALESLKQGLNLVYEWQTEIKKTPGDILVPMYPGTNDKSKKAILYLKAELKKKLNLDPPEIKLYGSVSNFVVNLIGTGAAQFLIIKFNKVSISATVGEKPSIDPDIEEVAFAGPLSFVNKLKDLIPSGGSSGGVGFSFGFDVQPSGVIATLTITLPNITVGVFSLMNMSFLMRLTVPFDGRPFSAYFAFCTRDNPFRLTIMVFGGGGYFGIEVTPKGVRMLEAAFEFGGNFAFDCGVASGGASIMAGIYYKLENKEVDGEMVEQSELTGYFRLTGNLSILGIIRVSLLFELKLTWQGNGKVFGVATIEVEIEILFVSFSVGVTVERQLKGSDGDPTFVDMLPAPSMWEDYCNAFA